MKKDILIVAIAAVAVAVLVSFVDIQSVDDYYLEHLDDITPESETVTISIRCDTIRDHWDDLDPALRDDQYVPPDGVLLSEMECVLRPGDTVFDILTRAVKHNRLQMEYQGAGDSQFGSVYIQGIGYLYELSCGPLSGWMYRVNGRFPDGGCSGYTLQDGDTVEWLYTCDLGYDIGGGFLGGFQGKSQEEKTARE